MAQWGMVIDLDRCTGCEACVIACHAENNLPIVGEGQSTKGRQINWIRVERYIEGEYPNVKARFMPILCQHCEEAPCEPVCPVYATYHNPEGLNAQVNNRCIGTRFCANACPYSVRFFNWFEPAWDPPLDQQLNTDVSVRPRGVIEKCTFCTQRIRRARDKAKDENRPLKDGEVQPACAQACPTRAMVFGDLEDTNSEISMLAKNRRKFHLLEELGTKPKVIYLREAD